MLRGLSYVLILALKGDAVFGSSKKGINSGREPFTKAQERFVCSMRVERTQMCEALSDDLTKAWAFFLKQAFPFFALLIYYVRAMK